MTGKPYRAHESAYVDEPVSIGAGTHIWHFSHVMANATIGRDCNLGQNTFVASGVVIGDRVKVQNNVSLYAGTVVEDEVFLGPSCVLTNVTNPRAQVDRRSLYEPTLLRRGATVGANATVVAADVPDYGLAMGVPAKTVGYVSRHGHRLHFESGLARCPEAGLRYQLDERGVRCLDLDEESPLPEALSRGEHRHDDYKAAGDPSASRSEAKP